MKISVIVLGALAVTFFMGRRSAALRHWVLAASVVCAAALPLLEAIVPVWTLPMAAPTAFEPYDDSVAVVGPMAPIRESGAGQPGTARTRTSAAVTSPWPDRAGLLRTVWIAGSLVSFLFLAAGILRLAWLAAHARRVSDGRWREVADELSRACGLRRPVVLLQTNHPSLLVTWGLVQPKVILPATADTWSNDRVRVVLTHELAHIRRGDWAVQMAAEILRAVYWFNPLLWVACRKLRLESEHACDDEVMTRGVEGSDYAGHLVELARTLNQRRTWCPAPAMARPSSLERRVRAMLNDRLNRTPITGLTRALTLAVLLAASAAVAAAQSGFVSFTGSVVDESGRSIPGTTLILVSEPRQMKYEVKAGETGQFEFVGLPPGDYGLEVRGLGFQVVKDALTITGQNLRRNVMLRLGTLQETISVRVDDRETRDAPIVKEVPMPARKECVASSTGGRIVPPRKIRDVRPQYPLGLRGTGTEGTVVMEGRIGLDGYIGDIRIVGDAHPDLAQAAVAAVREWRYTETLLNCEPAVVGMTITTAFQRAPPSPPPPPPAPRP